MDKKFTIYKLSNPNNKYYYGMTSNLKVRIEILM